MKVRDALRRGREILKNKGIESFFLDAEVILAYVLSKDRGFLFSHPEYELRDKEVEDYFEKISLREKHYPVAYITNCKEFYSINLFVKEGVLIPRPETELVVEEAIKIISSKYEEKVLIKVADLCTGSGAIAVSIALNLKNVFCYASDISDVSLEVALENARKHKVEDKICLLKGNLWEPFYSNNIFGLDVVISNPPYIPEQDLSGLPLDVKYEPEIALNGGPDGLYFYREIIGNCRNFMKPNGYVILEIGENQAEAIKDILYKNGIGNFRVLKDYAGRDRVVVASLRQEE
ncbi:MAG: peptide chain release factor N(5)-glutamine methyltransferase [Thermovenabulum sp.]|uniref:peptide chain release factor N(5)-glutamine methyltransferase n=1 Tax=Thermovenabulum sp. TaxID=3100335 RepID=UPI003C7B00C8